jgi:hypothetical protein
VLGRDVHGQFRAINTAYSRTVDAARAALYSTMREILKTGGMRRPGE